MAELTLDAALAAFSPIAGRGAGVSLEDQMRDLGWSEGPLVAGGGSREWINGEIVAAQIGRGPRAYLEVTLEIAWPDPDNFYDEDRLAAEFEDRFHRNLADAVASQGPPTFVGECNDDGFPEYLDGMMIALWRMGSGEVALNFMHEDQGLPFRISVTAN